MKCPNCGSDVNEGARFCDTCGAPLTTSVPDASTPDQPAPEAPISVEGNPEPSSPDIPEPSPRYETDPAVPPVEPEPQRVLHYDVVTPSSETVTGPAPSSIGTVSLVLGIVSILLSCVGCGGVISIAGLITGYLSRKTTSKQGGTIGMILSAIGLIVTIVFVCIFLVATIASIMNGNRSSYPGGY